ncbi:MAG: ornithine cyclodeaminase family protein [Candidatus Binatia bacterium]
MADVVPVIEDVFRRVGQGQSVVAPRMRLVHPPLPAGSQGQGRPWRRDLRIIPGGIEGIGYGIRIGGSVHRQAGGVMLLLFDWETMQLKALISDHLIHGVRSTAPDGVMAKYLALNDAATLGLIGSGRLARWAAEAVCAVRPICYLRVWSPNAAHRQEAVRYLGSRLGDGVKIQEVSGPEECVRDCQIVVTATKATTPVLKGEWLPAGCTVITNTPEELDQQSFRRGRIVTTYRDGVLTHVPPYHSLVELLDKGALSPEDFSEELGNIVTGTIKGRTTADEIIVCLNPAFGVLDAAIAEYVYQRALALGVGTELDP